MCLLPSFIQSIAKYPIGCDAPDVCVSQIQPVDTGTAYDGRMVDGCSTVVGLRPKPPTRLAYHVIRVSHIRTFCCGDEVRSVISALRHTRVPNVQHITQQKA